MEKNDGIDVGRWVDGRLATLASTAGWQPDVAAGLAQLNHSRDRGRVRRRKWVGAMATAAAICVCALAFPATGVFAQRCINACIAEAAPAGRFLWNSLSGFNGSPSGIVPVAQRRMAPDFTLPDASGKRVRLSEFHGQVVLLNFWATWCAPCRIEAPWFVELQRAYRDAGFVVAAVSLDEDGWSSVKPYVKETKINYRVMVGGGEIAKIYGFQSLPATVMIDRAGRIAATHIGLAEKKAYEDELKALLAER